MARIRKRTIYYSDVPTDLAINTITRDVSATINERAVNQSLIGVISTKKGSRPFDPEFGCDINSSLFDNINDLSAYQVEKSIEEAILNYEPRIRLKRVDVLPIYDENTYVITIEYHLITDRTTIYRLKTELRDQQ